MARYRAVVAVVLTDKDVGLFQRDRYYLYKNPSLVKRKASVKLSVSHWLLYSIFVIPSAMGYRPGNPRRTGLSRHIPLFWR